MTTGIIRLLVYVKFDMFSQEICTTEESYFQRLYILEEVGEREVEWDTVAVNHFAFFHQKYASPLSQNGVITTEDSNTLFRHIHVCVVQVHRVYYEHCQSQLCITIYYLLHLCRFSST